MSSLILSHHQIFSLDRTLGCGQVFRWERNEVCDLVAFDSSKLCVNFKTKTVVYAWTETEFIPLHETKGSYPDEMADLGQTFVMYNASTLHVWAAGTSHAFPCVEILTMCALFDGRIAASAYDGRVRVYEMSSGRCEMLDHGPSTLYDMTYNLVQMADGRLAGSKDHCVVLWDVSTGQCVQSIPHVGAITFLMAVGHRMLVGGDSDERSTEHCAKLSLLE